VTKSTDCKERLLEAAVQVFAERGFRDGSVREICRRSGANLAAVNYHFGDKERLYVESVRRAHARRAEGASSRQLAANAPPEVRLRGAILAFLAQLLSAPDSDWYARLMTREILEPTSACPELVRDFVRPNFERFMALFGELLPSDVDEERRRLIVFGVVGQCVYFRMCAPVARLLAPPEQYARFQPDYLADHITRSTLAVIAGFGGGSPQVDDPAALAKKRKKPRRRQIQRTHPKIGSSD